MARILNIPEFDRAFKEVEEARRRRGAARRPASTVLTAGIDGETLGG